jgi:hypothetical protein
LLGFLAFKKKKNQRGREKYTLLQHFFTGSIRIITNFSYNISL